VELDPQQQNHHRKERPGEGGNWKQNERKELPEERKI